MMIQTVALAVQSGGQNVFSQAGTVSLMGMATIFLVLALLWAAIEIMHRLLPLIEKAVEAMRRLLKKDKKASKNESAPEPTLVPVADSAPVAPVAIEDDGAIIAAITAAIMAMRSESGESSAFRVVSFKRANRK